MSKRTPDEWRTTRDREGHWWIETDDGIVADLGRIKAADALILGASRIMLEALRDVERIIGFRDVWTFAGREEALSTIRTAIAKARGEAE